jgi:membrane protein DedA with SNARE-associated domain
MTPEQFIATYGYVALFFGAIIEGETFLLIGGFLSREGILKLYLVALSAGLGAYCSDQFFFHLGRLAGIALLDKKPRWKKKALIVDRYIERFKNPLAFGFRFLWGIRNITAFLLGASGYPTAKFMVYNALGAIIWAMLFAYLGIKLGGLFIS